MEQLTAMREEIVEREFRGCQGPWSASPGSDLSPSLNVATVLSVLFFTKLRIDNTH